MSERYSIEITNQKAPAFKWMVLSIAIVNFFSFAYSAFYANSETSNLLIYVGLFLSFSILVAVTLPFYSKQMQGVRPQLLLVICAIIWMFSGAVLPGLMLAVFAVISVVASKKQLIVIDERGIKYPSFPTRIFLWKEVDFVLLKDDILSIEMKDNRLLQFTLDKRVADNLDPVNFNRFCKEMATTGTSS